MPIKLPLSANYNSLMNSDALFSDTIVNVTLAASTDTHVPVPMTSDLGGTNTATVNYLVARIRHTPNNDVWFANNAVAAVPAGATLIAATSELLDNNECNYKVKSGDVLHFITAASSVSLSIAFYWL
jgi:hypothetical protein